MLTLTWDSSFSFLEFNTLFDLFFVSLLLCVLSSVEGMERPWVKSGISPPFMGTRGRSINNPDGKMSLIRLHEKKN